MTKQDYDEIGRITAMFRRQWPIIVAATLVTALLAAGYAYMTRPKAEFVADTSARIVYGIGGIPGLPTVNGFVSVVASPEVRRSAAETLGLEPGKLPSASTAVDGKDTTIVHVRVKSPDRDLATKASAAYTEAARAEMMRRLEPDIRFQTETLESLQDRRPNLEKRLDSLDELIASGEVPVEQRASLQQAAFNVQNAVFELEDRIRDAELKIAQMRDYVEVESPRVSTSAGVSSLVSPVVRGIVIGFIIGLAFAWWRERSMRRA